jgi:hypothetical protein
MRRHSGIASLEWIRYIDVDKERVEIYVNKKPLQGYMMLHRKVNVFIRTDSETVLRSNSSENFGSNPFKSSFSRTKREITAIADSTKAYRKIFSLAKQNDKRVPDLINEALRRYIQTVGGKPQTN